MRPAWAKPQRESKRSSAHFDSPEEVKNRSAFCCLGKVIVSSIVHVFFHHRGGLGGDPVVCEVVPRIPE